MINDLIKELGLAGLPAEQQIKLINTMTESVLKRITVEALTRLSDTDQEKLLAFQESAATPEHVAAFLKEKIPDYANMQERVVRDFKAEMKSTMSLLQQEA